jgi:hypothetical protein
MSDIGTSTNHFNGVDRFLDRLALDGHAIGIRESLNVHRLAGKLNERQVSLAENQAARAMMTAVIARSPAEQRRIAELYDSVFSPVAETPKAITFPAAPTKIAPPQNAESLGRLLALAVALTLLVGLVIWASHQPSKPIDVEEKKNPSVVFEANTKANRGVVVVEPPPDYAWTTDALYQDMDRLVSENKISAGATLRELQKAGWPPKDATGGKQLPLTALVERLQLPPDWPVNFNTEQNRRKVKDAFVDFGIPSEQPEIRSNAFTAASFSTIVALLGVGDVLGAQMFENMTQSARIAKLREILPSLNQAPFDRISPDLMDRALATVLFDSDAMPKDFLDASWRAPAAQGLHSAPTWLRPIAIVLPFIFLGFWFLGLAARRRTQIRRRADRGAPLDHPFVLRAPEDIRQQRTDKTYLTRVAASLNVRQTIAAISIDPERTIHASIGAGGLFTPVRGRITATPAYLLFIEAQSAADQEAQRLEMLHQRLVDAGVNVIRFFYFNSPAWLFPEFGDDPVPIENVAAYYEDRRLIVLGEGRGFLAPLTHSPEPWTRLLTVWPQRAMLTPRPLDEWGNLEFTIARELGLPMGRATVEGLFALAELLGLDDGRDRPLFRAYGFSGGFDLKPLPALIASRPYYWLSENNPGEAEAKRLDSVLRYYLDAEGLLWLKALAVYPALQWDLTLYLGRTLELLHEPRLAALTLLPWLREGHMPQWLRKRLIATLPDDIRVQTIDAIHALMVRQDVVQTPHMQTLRDNPMRRPSLLGRQPSRDELFLDTLANEGDFPAPSWLKPGLRAWLATLSWRDVEAVALALLYAVAMWWLVPSTDEGALGPGAYMPLAALVALPLVGWLGWTYWNDRLRMPEWLLALFRETEVPEVKPQSEEFGIVKLMRSVSNWLRDQKVKVDQKAEASRDLLLSWFKRKMPEPATAFAESSSPNVGGQSSGGNSASGESHHGNEGDHDASGGANRKEMVK